MGDEADRLVDRMAHGWPQRLDRAMKQFDRYFSAEAAAEREERFQQNRRKLVDLLDDLDGDEDAAE